MGKARRRVEPPSPLPPEVPPEELPPVVPPEEEPPRPYLVVCNLLQAVVFLNLCPRFWRGEKAHAEY